MSTTLFQLLPEDKYILILHIFSCINAHIFKALDTMKLDAALDRGLGWKIHSYDDAIKQ